MRVIRIQKWENKLFVRLLVRMCWTSVSNLIGKRFFFLLFIELDANLSEQYIGYNWIKWENQLLPSISIWNEARYAFICMNMYSKSVTIQKKDTNCSRAYIESNWRRYYHYFKLKHDIFVHVYTLNFISFVVNNNLLYIQPIEFAMK